MLTARTAARFLLALVPVVALSRAADAQTVRDYVRLEDRTGTKLRGVGLVVGLPGTGDSAKDLLIARPLAQVYRHNGIPIATIEELAKGKSAALVFLEVDIPGSARIGDKFDVSVAASHNASSLRGGRLVLSPLMGPLPGQPHFAFASGKVVLDDPIIPTHGRVSLGAEITEEIPFAPLSDESFHLVLQPYAQGFASASALAAAIDVEYYGHTPSDLPRVATPLDDRTIRIDVPRPDRVNLPGFVGIVLSTRIEPSLLRLPPRVVVNQASGQIVLTADVRISAVALADDQLTITTVTPPLVPTPQEPLVERTRLATLTTAPTPPAEQARLRDLLDAFKQLDIPVRRQIGFLEMLKRGGQLHADLVIE